MKKYKIRHKDGTVKEVSEIELAKYGLKVPKAQNGIFTDEKKPMFDQYGNAINQEQGNRNSRQDYIESGQMYFDNAKPSVIPFETRDYNNGTITSGVQNAPFVNQWNSNDPNLSGQNLPDYASQINNPNFGGGEEKQGQGFNSDIFKTLVQGAAQIEPLARNAWTSLGNVIKNKRTQAYEANQLNKALRQPYDNQFSEDMFGSNQGLQLFADGGINKYKSYNHGGNILTEDKELIQLPNGLAETVYGDKHSAPSGGIPMLLPEDSKVFSEKLKLKVDGKKKSFSKLAKPFETKKDIEHLESSFSDKLNKETAELNIELKNNKLDEIFNLQEMAKISGHFGKKVAKETIENHQMKYGGKLPKAANGWENLSPSEKYNWYKNNSIYGNQNLTEADFLSSINNSSISNFYKDLYDKAPNPVTQSTPINNNFNYNIQRDRNVIDPLYNRMNPQTTPTGVRYEPPTVDLLGWKTLENQLNLAHPNGIPSVDNTKGNYGNISDRQQLVNLGYQEQYYDDMLETPKGRKELAKMWESKGITDLGENLGIKQSTKDLTKLQDKELYEALNNLRPAYLDSYPKVRKGDRYVNPNSSQTIIKETPISSPIPNLDKLTYQGKNNKESFNFPAVFPIGIPKIEGEDPAAKFEVPDRQIPFRRISPQHQLNEINRNTRAGLSLLGNTPTDVSNIANLLTQANSQGQQVINNTNQQNIQNQMNIDQMNTQFSRQRDLSQIQEDVRFTDNIAKRRAAIQAASDLNEAAYNQNWMNLAMEQRDKDFVNTIYNPNDFTNYNFGFTPPTTPSKAKKKSLGGKLKLTKKR